jgi:phage baseplate assembly protein V
MSGEFLNAQARPEAESESERGGVMVGHVIRNCDDVRQGRVQVRLAWRGGIEIWARVAAQDKGAYFIPQVGEEVVVAFHQGDGNEAYVLGQVWNDKNRPPRQGDEDPVNKRVLSTPWGHEIAFDQTEKSVIIKTDTGQHLTLKPDSVEIGVDDKNSAVISLDGKGNLTITAKQTITMKAQTIKLDASSIEVGDGKSTINIG